jgi:hypothetical protein
MVQDGLTLCRAMGVNIAPWELGRPTNIQNWNSFWAAWCLVEINSMWKETYDSITQYLFAKWLLVSCNLRTRRTSYSTRKLGLLGLREPVMSSLCFALPAFLSPTLHTKSMRWLSHAFDRSLFVLSKRDPCEEELIRSQIPVCPDHWGFHMEVRDAFQGSCSAFSNCVSWLRRIKFRFFLSHEKRSQLMRLCFHEFLSWSECIRSNFCVLEC